MKKYKVQCPSFYRVSQKYWKLCLKVVQPRSFDKQLFITIPCDLYNLLKKLNVYVWILCKPKNKTSQNKEVIEHYFHVNTYGTPCIIPKIHKVQLEINILMNKESLHQLLIQINFTPITLHLTLILKLQPS